MNFNITKKFKKSYDDLPNSKRIVESYCRPNSKWKCWLEWLNGILLLCNCPSFDIPIDYVMGQIVQQFPITYIKPGKYILREDSTWQWPTALLEHKKSTFWRCPRCNGNINDRKNNERYSMLPTMMDIKLFHLRRKILWFWKHVAYLSVIQYFKISEQLRPKC